MAAIFSHAAEKSYFGYGDLHAMGGYPMVGVGFRAQDGIHAFDLSANACFLNPPYSLGVFHCRGLYLYYPAKQGPYFGAGLGLLNEPETMKKMSGSFEMAMGWQMNSRHRIKVFLEIDGIVPFQAAFSRGMLGVEKIARIWPGLTIGFGF